MDKDEISQTLKDFFAPARDGATGHANCIECLQRSSADGGGRWNQYHSIWTCDECLPVVERRESEETEEGDALRRKIEGGDYTNADLDEAVERGLARKVYDDPGSNRPTGIEWSD